jgi:hypothetical protein
MDLLPHRHQSPVLALDFLHDPTQIASTNAYEPVEPDPTCHFQHDLGFTALAEHVHMRRAVMGSKNHEPEAMGTVHRHHQNNPSKLGFKDGKISAR